ncbi:MAG: sugar phosphate nucleotidyltransferase [bacterium]
MEDNKRVKSQESRVGSQNVYCAILVGGPGKRLWPLSTKEKPKPFLPLITDKPLIKETLERVIDVFPKERIRFVLSKEHKGLAKSIFPWTSNENYIVEPEPRDTAAAIGLVSFFLPEDATLIVLSSDHYISDKKSFQKGILYGIEFLKESPDFILTFGIKPERPETGYGYIERDILLKENIYKVARFVEKPDLETAKIYIENGNYFWNSGIFIFKNKRIQGLFKEFLPEHFKVLREKDMEGFRCLPKVSIDYGIMEHITTIGMIKADFKWDDIGGYSSLLRVHKKDKNNNLVFGDYRGIDTKDCIIYSKDAIIRTIGVLNLVIAHSNGNVLIASRDRLDEIKRLLDE